jgi:UDP-N-acetylmuramoylalanine--D-glutamate ligase
VEKGMSYQGKKVLVVGLGISGRAAAKFLLHKEAAVWGVDRNVTALQESLMPLKEKGLIVQSDELALSLADFDLIVMSPGIAPTHPIYAQAFALGKPVWGEIELGCRNMHNPVIGVTGTNGKTTVTLLIAHVLNHFGKKAHALGNVGIPLTRELLHLDPTDIVVLELSSYQLETLNQKVLDHAIVLNITPDHLDRYPTMHAYASAKFGIERCLKADGRLYVEESALQAYPNELKLIEAKTYGYSPQCFIYTDFYKIFINGQAAFDLPQKYQGKISHEIENIMAAYAICHEVGVPSPIFIQALHSFKKPPHRIEFVTEKKGVTFYDDSKGTNIDAVIRAVQSLPGSIILIAGGVDKGSSYTPWLEGFANKVKCICAIGQAAGKIKQQLSHCIPVMIFSEIDQAVQYAAGHAQPGDNVLLSPGCASFDMFRDYAHRGTEFQRAVRQL